MKDYIVTYYTNSGIIGIKNITCFTEDLEYIFMNVQILKIELL